MDKRDYYRQSSVAANYETLRFSGFGGRYVHKREVESIRRLLPASLDALKLLDIPCGTGRVMRELAHEGCQVYGVDSSKAMLNEFRAVDSGGSVVCAMAEKLPYASSSLDIVVSLRFTFHLEALEEFFREISRVLKPGGVFVFDTYRWSPLMIRVVPMKIGGYSKIHSVNEILRLAHKYKFQLTGRRVVFLFSPLIYRFSPPLIVKFFDYIERWLPPRLLNVIFWSLRKEG